MVPNTQSWELPGMAERIFAAAPYGLPEELVSVAAEHDTTPQIFADTTVIWLMTNT